MNLPPEKAALVRENERLKAELAALKAELAELDIVNEKLEEENDRLARGEFTEKEFQTLCHNFGDHDYCAFAKGCAEYQKKLFGRCEREELQAELAAYREPGANAVWWANQCKLLEAELAALKAKQADTHDLLQASLIELAEYKRSTRDPEPERKEMPITVKSLQDAIDRTAPTHQEQMEKRRKEDYLRQLRSEVKVSPVRCQCGGVGVVLNKPSTPIWPCKIMCVKCGNNSSWNSRESTTEEWKRMNAPATAEVELLACFCGSPMICNGAKLTCENDSCPIAIIGISPKAWNEYRRGTTAEKAADGRIV